MTEVGKVQHDSQILDLGLNAHKETSTLTYQRVKYKDICLMVKKISVSNSVRSSTLVYLQMLD